MISIKSLSLAIGSVSILDGLNAHFADGSLNLIAGENGAGKTSLLKAILGIIPYQSGEISVMGTRVGTREWRKIRRAVGYVEQERAVSDFPASAFEVAAIGACEVPATRSRRREAVLEALRRRRCYATSGAKIGLFFEVDDRPMGEELIAGAPVPFRVVVAATAPIRSLVLVTNGGEEMALSAKGLSATAQGMLPPPAEGGFSYYYVRIIQEDGEIAWSSPVWLDAPSPA